MGGGVGRGEVLYSIMGRHWWELRDTEFQRMLQRFTTHQNNNKKLYAMCAKVWIKVSVGVRCCKAS